MMFIIQQADSGTNNEAVNMRYVRGHKAETRRRILTAAGKRFRRQGYEATSVDRVMADAGLTRGGFYAHFRSKAALFREVVRHDHGLIRMLARRQGETPAALRDEAIVILKDYLDPAHCEVVSRGCTMAALSVDVGRAPKSARTAYAEALRALAYELSRGSGASREEDPAALAAAALAIGGLILARASGDDALAANTLRACRDQAVRLLEDMAVPSRAAAETASRSPRSSPASRARARARQGDT